MPSLHNVPYITYELDPRSPSMIDMIIDFTYLHSRLLPPVFPSGSPPARPLLLAMQLWPFASLRWNVRTPEIICCVCMCLHERARFSDIFMDGLISLL
jgi:hypothetical protein